MSFLDKLFPSRIRNRQIAKRDVEILLIEAEVHLIRSQRRACDEEQSHRTAIIERSIKRLSKAGDMFYSRMETKRLESLRDAYLMARSAEMIYVGQLEHRVRELLEEIKNIRKAKK